MSHTHVEKPALTVDITLFALTPDNKPDDIANPIDSKVLLIQRKYEPFKGFWALPGGHVDKDEPLETAALRELQEETSVSGIELEQFGAFGTPGRDPRGWYVSIGYLGIIGETSEVTVQAADDATNAQWFPVKHLPDLAFDHKEIIKSGLRCVVESYLLENHVELDATVIKWIEPLIDYAIGAEDSSADQLLENLIEPLDLGPPELSDQHSDQLSDQHSV